MVNGSESGDRSPTRVFDWPIDDRRSTTGGHNSLTSAIVLPEMAALVLSDLFVSLFDCKIRMTKRSHHDESRRGQGSTAHLILLSRTAMSVSDRHLRPSKTPRRFSVHRTTLLTPDVASLRSTSHMGLQRSSTTPLLLRLDAAAFLSLRWFVGEEAVHSFHSSVCILTAPRFLTSEPSLTRTSSNGCSWEFRTITASQRSLRESHGTRSPTKRNVQFAKWCWRTVLAHKSEWQTTFCAIRTSFTTPCGARVRRCGPTSPERSEMPLRCPTFGRAKST